MSTITRIGFCPICAKEGRAQIDQIFLAFGSTSNNYHVLRAQRQGYRPGYVPHIYKAKLLGENVIIRKSCAMYECGVDMQIKFADGYDFEYYFVKKWTREVWTLKTWNSLVLLKHNEFTNMYEI